MIDPIVVQRPHQAEDIPSDEDLCRWARAALKSSQRDAELVIRLVGEAEGAGLNRQFRGKDGATNVLSFPHAELPVPEAPLGDLVICVPVVRREAQEQGKALAAHWAHMVVHGILHLRGYDHDRDLDAERMEALEKEILNELGFADPYRLPAEA